MIRDHAPVLLPWGRYRYTPGEFATSMVSDDSIGLNGCHILPEGIARARPDVTGYDDRAIDVAV